MSTQQSPIASLHARSIASVLGELRDLLRRSQRGSKLPLVSLYMHGGREIKGSIIDLSEEVGAALVATQSDGGCVHDVHYVDVRALAGLVVHDAVAWIEVLSAGRFESAEGSPPSRLELKRRLQEYSGRLAVLRGEAVEMSVDWDRVPSGDASYWSLSRLIDEFVRLLLDLGRDSLGREALTSKVRKVQFVSDGRKGVSLEGGALVVRADLMAGKIGRLSGSDLSQALSAVL